MAVDPNKLISHIKVELFRCVDDSTVGGFSATSGYRWFGLRTPVVRRLAALFLREIKAEGVRDIDSVLELCNKLLAPRISEYRTIAFQWSFQLKQQFEPRHFSVFEKWVNTYLTGWGSCDDLCTHTMGCFVYKYPQFIPQVKTWVESPNPMIRRASAVTFIYGLRRGKFLQHIFDVANALLTDSDIYVLKGYGWMLKEASNQFPDEVFDYVMKKKVVIPRVSLRYAIENMPKDWRKMAMEK